MIAKILIAKCRIAKLPIAKGLIAKIPIAKGPIDRCLIAKWPIAKCPITKIQWSRSKHIYAFPSEFFIISFLLLLKMKKKIQLD